MPYSISSVTPHTHSQHLGINTSAQAVQSDLSSLLKKSDFSIADFELALQRGGINIAHLSRPIKDELSFICSIHNNNSAKQVFCDEIIRWTDRNISAIPLSDRTDEGDAGITLSIQKYATQQLFLPDTGKGATQDRWQLLKDCFQLQDSRFNSVNLKSMAFEVENDAYTYGEEFRFCGNSAVITWLKDENTKLSLAEFVSGHPQNLYTYENHAPANSRSFTPKIENNKLLDCNGEEINKKIYIYVLTPNHELKIAKDIDGFGSYHHSYMNSGLPIICAGEVAVDHGKIIGINNFSGHYRPSEDSLSTCIDILNTKAIISDNCCIMQLGRGIRHFIFDPNLMNELRKSESFRHRVLPAIPSNKNHEPYDGQRYPVWQQHANSTIRDFLLEQKNKEIF
ncbi:hypothetical protein [Pseudomonas fluorescens]|uniref:Uncharacterized protein n=1 Tax=Pseudomonas fluorescens TaxID=294 RepID=A0A5E7JPY7_PSEFL|nr:hypothetical protein [Pseudomonas fluorescens]VVO91571.1 hypothetical protein PS880_02333 [Pseudomonas fluorescens]